jgi:DNA-binding response OmpR family regulator
LVLLIEDILADAELAKEYIEETGYWVSIAIVDDGQKAIDYFADIENKIRERPDLVLLDLNLPRRSGHEVLEAIRRCDRTINVFIYSGSKSPEDMKMAKDNKVDGYLVKPMVSAEIDATIKELTSIFKSLGTSLLPAQ